MCGGGGSRGVVEGLWVKSGKKSPKNEQSEEHGKSLVPMPRIRHSKHTHADIHTQSVYLRACWELRGEGSDKNNQCSSASEGQIQETSLDRSCLCTGSNWEVVAI